MKNPRRLILSALLFFTCGSFAANETPQSFTLDGTLLAADHVSPLRDATAKVRVQILNPSKTCVLYDEEQTVNTLSSDGHFNIQIGSTVGASKRRALDSANAMALVYQNSSAIPAQTAPSQTCAGSSYTPVAGDVRYVRVIVTPTSSSPETLTPDMVLDSVPNAVVAQSLQGVEKSGFLQVNPSVVLTQAKLEQFMQTLTTVPGMGVIYDGTNFQSYDPKNGSLLTSGSVTDTQISDVEWNKVTSVPPAIAAVAGLTCANGELLKFISGAWACGTESGVGVENDPTVSLFAKTTPGTGLTTNGSNQIVPDFGTAAGKVAQGNDSRFSDSRAPNGSASGDLSGTYPSPTVAKIQGRGVSVTAPADGQVLKYDIGTSTWIPVNFGIGDLKTSLGTSQFISAACTSAQTLIWSAVTDNFQCTNISLPIAQVTGTLPVAQGGTGQTTGNAAFNALAPSQTGQSGKFLTTNGTSASWATALTSESDPKIGANSTNYLSKWDGSALVASGVYESAGNVGIGTTNTSSTTLIAYGTQRLTVASAGTHTATDGVTQSGFAEIGGFSPTANTNMTASVGTYSTFAPPTGVTINNAAGVFVSGGTAGGAGTITNGYGIYIANPSYGTNKYAGYFGGSVGIGTFAPGSRLDVKQAAATDDNIRLVDDNTANYWGVSFNNSTLTYRYNTTDQFVITSAGNVGIGSAAPTQKLDVNGTVKATAYQGDGSALTGITATSYTGTLGVANGGTGATTLASNGLLVGNGTSAVTTIAPAASAVLLSNGSNVPAWSQGTASRVLRSNGTAVSWSQVTLSTDVTGTLPVANGGTGATTLTGYLKGNGTSAFTASATIPAADVSGNISGNAANVTGTIAVANGGTGATTLTDHGVLLGSGTAAVSATSAGTAGQYLRSSGASADPAFATITASEVSNAVINGGNGAAVNVGTTNSTALTLSTANTARVTVTSGGLVGIATTAPSSSVRLHVYQTDVGGAADAAMFSNTDSGVSGSSARIYLAAGGAVNRSVYIEGQNTTGSGNGHSLIFGTSQSTTNPAERMRIDHAGNVGIGTTNPTYKLHVVGTAGLSTGTAWTNASDVRLKDIHGDYERGLDEILRLHTVRYAYKKDNPLGLPSDFEKTGFVAQEVQKVIPEAVNKREDGYLEINVDPIHWAVVNAIKEFFQRWSEDRAEVDRRLAEKDREIAEIKSYLCTQNPSAPLCKSVP